MNKKDNIERATFDRQCRDLAERNYGHIEQLSGAGLALSSGHVIALLVAVGAALLISWLLYLVF